MRQPHPFFRRAWIFAAVFALSTCGGEPAPREEATPRAEAAAQTAPGASLFAGAPGRRWRLPNRLREISGLATAHDGRLFGHDDERAIIYALDDEGGRIVKNFALGEPILHGDFEGLAITPGGDFYLVASDGRLLRFREGGDGAHVAYEALDTGLGRVCEVEGLAYASARDSLILACKTNYARGMRKDVALYSWSARTPERAARLWLRLDGGALGRAAGVESFHPSGIELDPRSGRIILLAARERGLAEVAADGTLLATRRLNESHRQAEGVAIMPDGALVIADEGAGAHALLTRYARVR